MEPTVERKAIESFEPQSAVPAGQKSEWVTPEITSFMPVTATRGIRYIPGDGLNNLT